MGRQDLSWDTVTEGKQPLPSKALRRAAGAFSAARNSQRGPVVRMAAVLLAAVVCAGGLPPSSLSQQLIDTANFALGLPPVELVAGDSAATIELGRKLFSDKALSASGTVSCASCHVPAKAMADGRPVSLGDGDQRGSRNAPSLINLRFNDSFFWDGRRATLEEQATDPLLNPIEHGVRDASDLLRRLVADPEYVRAFREAYRTEPGQIDISHVARAIASFERTMVAGDSPFDRYYYGGDKSALSESAARGLKIFEGPGQCATCHVIGPKHALFTDQKYHRLSVGMAPIAHKLPELTRRVVDARASGQALDHVVLNDHEIAELGRFAVTLNPVDIGKFRTPSLRNVALTGPYMHDGSVKTLEEAVELEIYYRGNERGYPLILTLQEQDDLIAFMHALTSPHTDRWSR